jgi:hypothetical protein
MSTFEQLLDQVDGFIRKHYKNHIVKGFLLFLGVFLLTFLLVVTLEYFGRFGSFVRASLFFTFVLSNGFILIKFIILPYLKLNALGRRINRLQAAEIIGGYFPEVSDRLLNTLQLSSDLNENSRDYELLRASVQQRSASLAVVPFADAIDIKENRRFVIWLLPLLFLMIGIGVLSPSFFQKGTERVVFFTKDFPVEGLFDINIVAERYRMEEGEDFIFNANVEGDEFPEKLYMSSNRGTFLMERVSKNTFTGRVKQLREDISISVRGRDSRGTQIISKEREVEVISKVALKKFEATITYPKYLGLKSQTINNATDLTVPEGAIVTWNGASKNTSEVRIEIDTIQKVYSQAGFSFTNTFKRSTRGKLCLKNVRSGSIDSLNLDIDVIPDAYPGIVVEEESDSLKDGVRFFSGMASDDHGVFAITFTYKIVAKNGTEKVNRLKVKGGGGTESLFNYAVDFRREQIALEDKIEYFFTVLDNDGVNGSKATRSRTYVYKVPTLEEVNDKREDEQEKSKKDLQNLQEKTQDFLDNLDRLKKDVINSNRNDWNQQNSVEQLQQQHESILQDLEQLQEELDNSTEEKDQLSEIDEELLKQQEAIEELLEELMDDELKDLLDQLEELMKEQDKNRMEENLDKLEMSSEDMKNQLDRSLEMLKKMQVNEKIDDIENELNELAKEQENLNKELNDEGSSDDLKEKQDELNEKFDEVKEEMDKLDSLNNELERPMDMNNLDEDKKETKEEMNNASDNLDKSKEKKADQNQKNAAQKMKDMAAQMDAMQAQSNQKQQQEDIDMLRRILESLVRLSIDQEETMDKLKFLSDSDPSFFKQTRRQRRIIDDTKIVKDSLYALAKRQPKIASFIDKELNQIKVNHELTLEDIDERRRGMLSAHQQYAMTSYNNLALMLNESLQQMQEQMQQMMPGSGACEKPGGSGKPQPGNSMSPGDMKQMLKDQLEQMQKGSQEGGKKPGEKKGSGVGMGLGNKEIAKMAAQQSAIRKKLEQMRQELNKDGKGTGNKLNPLIRELEQQQQDLINKRFDRDLVKRQREILTRLLESDKALMERGLDEKRESKEGKNINNSNQIQFKEYNQEKLRQIELLRSVDPTYNKYYKDRANEYFNRML